MERNEPLNVPYRCSKFIESVFYKHSVRNTDEEANLMRMKALRRKKVQLFVIVTDNEWGSIKDPGVGNDNVLIIN